MITDIELSRILTNIVSLVEGVGDVYPSGTFTQTVALTAVNAMADDDTDDAKVAVSRNTSGQCEIMATIGIANGHAAPIVLRAVSDMLRAYLESTEPASPPPTLDVKVSRIETEFSVV